MTEEREEKVSQVNMGWREVRGGEGDSVAVARPKGGRAEEEEEGPEGGERMWR